MNYIVDDIGTVVAAMRNGGETPYYLYGHRIEIANRLLEKDKDKVLKYKKYPLVALRMDIPERVENGVWNFTLNVAILDYTDKNYTAEERYTNVFKPVLYPLYERFLLNLRIAGLFMWDGDLIYPEHVKLDRPFWGTTGDNVSSKNSEGNAKYIFNDPLDAIELVDLKLSKRIKNC